MVTRTVRWIKAIHEDDGGAIAAEKILILALISIPIVILLALFGQKIIGWFKDQDAKLPAPS